MAGHPLDQELQRIIRDAQLRTIPPLEAEVLLQAGQALDLKLLVSDELRALWDIPAGLQGVPLALQGCWQVQLAPGARVVLEFLDGDARKPIVRTVISGTVLQAEVDATAIKIGAHATSVDLGPGAVKVPVACTGSTVKVVVATGIGTVDNTPPIQSVVKV